MTWNKWWMRPEGGRGPVSRRAFLGGGAAVITLPWLESLARPALALSLIHI